MTPIAALLALGALAACGGKPPAAPGAETEPAADDGGYLAPPSVVQARRQGDLLTLSGQAPAGARVRLATPAGEAVFAAADARGRWSLALPAGTEPRIYGLSMMAAGRQVQAQGYLLLTPKGQAALLRAGTGAVRLDPLGRAAIGAFDFDRDGAAVVSGVAPAGATLSLRLDGRQTAQGRADAAGRYVMALPSAVAPGQHRLEVLGDGFDSVAAVQTSQAAPLAGGPFRSQLSLGGVRADWVTPGGGVQSTVLFD